MRRLIAPLAVTLFALFVAQPLFVQQLTCSDDSAFHIVRAVALEQLIDSGHFFGRWSPYMAHGFGFPFFNYYGPLSSYMMVAVHTLGFIYPVALHILLGLCIWGAGLGTYLFVREWWGEAGGVAAAVVYMTAPYLAYDILFRAVLAETLALALIPIILFTLHRALSPPLPPGRQPPERSEVGKGPGVEAKTNLYALLAAFSFAALLFTHNTTSLASAPLIAGYVVLLAFLLRDWRKLIHGGLILLVGALLAARFWLPALAEINLVQTDRLLVPPIFTYYTNYLTPAELLALPTVIDPLLINPSPAKAVGLTAVLLSLLGLAALAYRLWAIRHHNESRFTQHAGRLDFESRDLPFGIWSFAFLLLYAFLTLSISKPVWDYVPLVKFIQFPWRFLGPAALCTALLAGAAVHWRPNRATLVAGAVALAATVAHLSWWYPRYCTPFAEMSLAGSIQYEYDTSTIGTTAKGEYLPKTVRYLPGDDTIAQALMRGETPQYLTGLPTDARLKVLDPDPLTYRASVMLPAPVQLTFNQFYFPGWQAFVDDKPAGITLIPDTGLMTVAVPSGEHTIRFYFGNTAIRTLGDSISAISLIFILACGAWHIANRSRLATAPPVLNASHLTPHASRFTLHASRFTDHLPFAFLFLPTLLLLARPLLIDRTTNPLRRSPFDGSAISIGEPVNVNLSSGLSVFSTEFPSSVPSGSEFDIVLYLAPRERVAREYRPRFDLTTPDGLIWNNGNEALPPRWHREPPETQYWVPGQYAQWARRETILPGTPPGDYQLAVTIFDRATLAPDSIVDENGNLVSPVTALGTVHVARPSTPPSISDLDIQYRVDHDFGPFTLLGYNLDRVEARPGDAVLVTLFFHADEAMSVDHHFNLLDPSYPTSQWRSGDIWRFQALARIPASAPSGPFQFHLIPLTLSAPDLALQPINLTAPERLFSPPAIATSTSIRFGDSIELAGYEIQSTADQLQITLLWHALAETSIDLSAFVHIEDSSEHIVAQSDAVPANWGRPTTGWVTGEYILDSHTLSPLPSGEYAIYVGLADRINGARILTASGDRAALGVYKAP